MKTQRATSLSLGDLGKHPGGSSIYTGMAGWAGSAELDSEGEELFGEKECDAQILEGESQQAGCFWGLGW